MIVQGDALTVLKRMDTNSIHCAITSPPYYSPHEGLRNYDLPPVTWPDEWTGHLGAEPTPQMYTHHLTLICNEVLRVLRPDGTLWLNLGDSRAGSGRGPSGKSAAIKNQETRQGFVGTPQKIPLGFKRKDIFGIPFRVGFALQEAGWYWRDCIPWLKHNGMPGSYKDRPVSNIEWILILSKSTKNYYDHVAVMQKSSESYNKDKRPRGVLRQRVNPNTKYDRNESQFKKQDEVGNPTYTGFNKRYAESGSCDKRFLRSSDFFFQSFQGLWLDEDGDPLAMIANPKSYKGQHFASFPVMLPETCLLASTSEKGVCQKCGSPWKRITEKGELKTLGHSPSKKPQEIIRQFRGDTSVPSSGFTTNQTYEIITTGWQPSCTCGIEEITPAVVLDPFLGSGATGVAALKRGRNFIGIELKWDYCNLATERIKSGK